ncbi:MAG: outer membrane beta-barrel protein [Deltaproteobacteria bacterium]|nr:outer membrane beta-barrel protein [Deltaproteobacteria bacterium]
MKKSAFVLSCCVIALSATSASAAGMYVSGKLGLSVPPTLTLSGNDYWGTWADDISFNTGMAINAAFGYDFDNFRAEAEIGYQKNNFDKTDWQETDRFGNYSRGTGSFADGDMTSTSFFANGYYDFKNKSPFVPYLGAGIGYAIIKLNDVKSGPWDNYPYNNDDGVFAYQVMAGVSYVINKTVAIDLSYRYVGASDPSFDDFAGKTDFEFSSHNFLLGARVNF